jgi:hypothetical protein
MIMYMPEAEATLGGSPMLSNRGLKMAPPPRPRAPETNPPRNEKISSFLRLLPYMEISQLANPGPYLIFIICSY